MVVTAVVVVSSSGLQIARKIAVHFEASLRGKFAECDILIEKYPDQLRSLFIDNLPLFENGREVFSSHAGRLDILIEAPFKSSAINFLQTP